MTFTSNNLSSLLYLILVLLILLFLFFLSNKKYLNRNLQSLSIWGLIFFGAMACYYIWDDIQTNIQNDKERIQLIEKAGEKKLRGPLTKYLTPVDRVDDI